MYSKIEIHETDFPNKYLFINNDNLIFGGFMIKEIVELLKKGLTISEITDTIAEKYQTEIDRDVVEKIINKEIKSLVEKPKKRKMIKLFKVSIPSTLKFPKLILGLFNYKVFYSILIVSLLINISFFLTNDEFSIDLTNMQRFYAILILLVMLAFHELGHIISAKYYNINIKESGLAIYFIVPILYVNLNESWKLERNKKIKINLSGIYFQSLIGVFIYLLIRFTDIQTSFLWYLFIVNFFVIFLNLNPFFRFDGYWVLADLMKENNLNGTSTNYLKSIIVRTEKKFSLKIKIYAILKLLFLVGFFGYIAFELYKYIRIAAITNNMSSIYISVGVLITIFLLNLINYKYGFRKPKTAN
jgi:putative peptide zinc metalloprotease protein